MDPTESSILDLPLSILVKILQQLSSQDLLSLRKASKRFQWIIQSEVASLAKEMPVPDIFPDRRGLRYLRWLSLQGNMEAAIKLAIGRLYHENLHDTGVVRMANSIQAAQQFCRVEKSGKLKYPLTWVFVRPPWSNAIVCRKAMVWNHFRKLATEGLNNPNVLYCIGKVLLLFENDSTKQTDAVEWLRRAGDHGSLDALFELWKLRVTDSFKIRSIEDMVGKLEPGRRLNSLRELRSIAFAGYEPALIQLCRLYVRGHCESTSSNTMQQSVRKCFAGSKPLPNMQFHIDHPRVIDRNRYILIDWLIEVANMKDFSSATIQLAVQCLDRYLRRRSISKVALQLLGIACLVLSSRIMENEVLTIREAVWLTDSAYRYGDLVIMTEDIVSSLEGNIHDSCTWDFLSILTSLESIDTRTRKISEFLADYSLLFPESFIASPAVVACSCLLLAKLTVHPDCDPWCSSMQALTGFSTHDLKSATMRLHKSCFAPYTKSDNRELKSVEERYRVGINAPFQRKEIANSDVVEAYFNAASSNNNALDRSVEETTKSFDDGLSIQSLELQKCGDIAAANACHSDDELDTDTPPALSCAYLVQPDTKTRKRIRDGVANCKQPHKGKELSRISNFDPNNSERHDVKSRKEAQVFAGLSPIVPEAVKENSPRLVPMGSTEIKSASSSSHQCDAADLSRSKSMKLIR